MTINREAFPAMLRMKRGIFGGFKVATEDDDEAVEYIRRGSVLFERVAKGDIPQECLDPPPPGYQGDLHFSITDEHGRPVNWDDEHEGKQPAPQPVDGVSDDYNDPDRARDMAYLEWSHGSKFSHQRKADFEDWYRAGEKHQASSDAETIAGLRADLAEAEARGRNQALVVVESEMIPDRDHASEDYADGWHAARSHIMARLHRWPGAPADLRPSQKEKR